MDMVPHLPLIMLLTVVLIDLVTHQHNEIRDAFGDLSSLVWSPFHCEPIV